MFTERKNRVFFSFRSSNCAGIASSLLLYLSILHNFRLHLFNWITYLFYLGAQKLCVEASYIFAAILEEGINFAIVCHNIKAKELRNASFIISLLVLVCFFIIYLFLLQLIWTFGYSCLGTISGRLWMSKIACLLNRLTELLLILWIWPMWMLLLYNNYSFVTYLISLKVNALLL